MWHLAPNIETFSFKTCSSVTTQPAPTVHPLVTATLFPTKHLASKTLLLPILRASTVQPTSKTFWEPITSTGVLSLLCWSRGNLEDLNDWSKNEGELTPVYLWTIFACSSIKHCSPMMMGPASAMMVARGWTIVPDPTVMSPLSFASSQTIAPGNILMLNHVYETQTVLKRLNLVCYLFFDIFMPL